jgi:hypothetical protein
MRRISILMMALSLALSALVALPATESALPITKPVVQSPVARQWQVKNDSTVKASTPFELHNTYRRQRDLSSQLGYTKEEHFLSSDEEDVGWVGQSGGQFEFRRPNIRDHRTVSPFENLALYNTKSRKYMTGGQTYRGGLAHGDHLWQVWSESPSYEWQVHDRQGADFALFNTNKRDYIVAADGGRSVLKWLGSGSR